MTQTPSDAKNLVLRNEKRLAETHYILHAGGHPRRWVRVSISRIKQMRARHATGFCLVITGDPERPDDFYAIPFSAIQQHLTPTTLYAAPDGTRSGWSLYRADPAQHVFTLSLGTGREDAKARFDATQWHGNAAVLGLPDGGPSPDVLSDVPRVRATDEQGRQMDPARRDAVERHAMKKALELYPGAEDTSETEAFDLRWLGGSEEVRIEVKGTTGDGAVVMITRGELENARGTGWRTDLVVVSHIILIDDDANGPLASGGRVRRIEAWSPRDADLDATQFRCRTVLDVLAASALEAREGEPPMAS